MRKFNLTLKRFLFVVVAIFSIYAISKVEVSAGYMYASDNQLIVCSDGFTVTTDGIYNILSTAWQGFLSDSDAGNTASSFNSPEDLALYTDKAGNQTIYIVDSSSNKLFIFDGSLNYIDTLNKFEIIPDNFDYEQLVKIKTRGTSGKTSVGFWSDANQAKYIACKNVGYVNRTEEQKFYIELNEVSGVYRSLRPLKDASGKTMLDENNKTIYQDIIYLCDTKNQQVLLLDSETYKVIQVVSSPVGYDFSEKFQPKKIVTDSTGRMFIISDNIYEGIVLMSYQGEFMRMVGVNYSTLSVWDAIKRNFKTEEQLAQETSVLQASFNNLCIDSKGFLYTISAPVTNADKSISTDAMIKKINQANADVLKRTGYSKPIGDLVVSRVGSGSGNSKFTSITVNDYGVYTVADSQNNRLFTYDDEGNLLYISGGSGVQVTDIANPTAIVYQGTNLLVLDKSNKCVMRFEPTDFAKKINQAVYYEFIGDSVSAADQWQDVINSNPQYELAYVGVGKKLYEEGRYQEAMLNFKKGADVKYYSRAYKMYRDNIIKQYFPAVVTVVLILVAGGIVWKVVRKVKNKKPDEDGDLL